MSITRFLQKISVEDSMQQAIDSLNQTKIETEKVKAKQKELMEKKRLNDQIQKQLTHRKPGRPANNIIHQQNNIYGGTITLNYNISAETKLQINEEVTDLVPMVDIDSSMCTCNNNVCSCSSSTSRSSSSISASNNSSTSSTSSSNSSSSSNIFSSISSSNFSNQTVGTFNRPKEYTDWVGNFQLFSIIVAAVYQEKSWRRTIQRLRAPNFAGQFDKLSESTLRGYFEKGTFKLLESVRQRWQLGNNALFHSDQSGRQYFLANYPDIDQAIKQSLSKMRNAGCVVNSLVASALMQGIIKHKAPNLIKEVSLSRAYCRRWLRQYLRWTYKRGTTSGQKLPLDWEKQIKLMQYRCAAVIAASNVKHSSLVINWDQTGVMLMPTFHYTYHDRTEKRVPIVALDEKRQITAVVASSLNGDLLPLQLIFGGQDKNKKQQKSVPKLSAELKQEVYNTYQFHLTQTKNHWSTLDSMQDYIRKIIVPYVNQKKMQHSCPDSEVLLIFDCWSVHKSAEFLGWLSSTYPTFRVVFIPAGCTGKAQPADVLLQKPFKTEISNCYTQWMVQQVGKLLAAGVEASNIRVDTGVTLLKPLVVDWCFKSWKLLSDKHELIEKGWKHIGFGELFDTKFQLESLKLVTAHALELDPTKDKNEIEPEPISYADINAINEEILDEDDEADEVDERTAEENSNVLLVQLCTASATAGATASATANAASTANVANSNSPRRSPRLSSQSFVDKRIAAVLQEQNFIELD
jgi:hypothetical protein